MFTRTDPTFPCNLPSKLSKVKRITQSGGQGKVVKTRSTTATCSGILRQCLFDLIKKKILKLKKKKFGQLNLQYTVHFWKVSFEFTWTRENQL